MASSRRPLNANLPDPGTVAPFDIQDEGYRKRKREHSLDAEEVRASAPKSAKDLEHIKQDNKRYNDPIAGLDLDDIDKPEVRKILQSLGGANTPDNAWFNAVRQIVAFNVMASRLTQQYWEKDNQRRMLWRRGSYGYLAWLRHNWLIFYLQSVKKEQDRFDFLMRRQKENIVFLQKEQQEHILAYAALVEEMKHLHHDADTLYQKWQAVTVHIKETQKEIQVSIAHAKNLQAEIANLEEEFLKVDELIHIERERMLHEMVAEFKSVLGVIEGNHAYDNDLMDTAKEWLELWEQHEALGGEQKSTNSSGHSVVFTASQPSLSLAQEGAKNRLLRNIDERFGVIFRPKLQQLADSANKQAQNNSVALGKIKTDKHAYFNDRIALLKLELNGVMSKIKNLFEKLKGHEEEQKELEAKCHQKREETKPITQAMVEILEKNKTMATEVALTTAIMTQSSADLKQSAELINGKQKNLEQQLSRLLLTKEEKQMEEGEYKFEENEHEIDLVGYKSEQEENNSLANKLEKKIFIEKNNSEELRYRDQLMLKERELRLKTTDDLMAAFSDLNALILDRVDENQRNVNINRVKAPKNQ